MSARLRLLAVLLASAGCRSTEEAPAEGPGPPEIVRAALAHPGFRWQTRTAPHFLLHVPEGSYASTRVDTVSRALAQAWDDVSTRLSIDGEPERVEAFVVEDRNEIAALVGQPAGGWSDTRANAAFFVYNAEGAPPYRHELGHLLSWRRWGDPAALWLSEGVAVYAVGGCAGHGLHEWAASLAADGLLVPLNALEPFDFTKAAPHLEAGSFLAYVAETHGIGALRALWSGGLRAAEEATEQSAAALEASWQAHVARVVLPPGERPDGRGRVRCE
ncbi:MAG TPA: hypothetical protein VGB53_02760 [Rubricoccaceae bacterium]|jgi:hypothetical protein